MRASCAVEFSRLPTGQSNFISQCGNSSDTVSVVSLAAAAVAVTFLVCCCRGLFPFLFTFLTHCTLLYQRFVIAVEGFLVSVTFIILITSLTIICLLHLHLKRVPNAY
jgi:hypothetical protein